MVADVGVLTAQNNGSIKCKILVWKTKNRDEQNDQTSSDMDTSVDACEGWYDTSAVEPVVWAGASHVEIAFWIVSSAVAIMLVESAASLVERVDEVVGWVGESSPATGASGSGWWSLRARFPRMLSWKSEKSCRPTKKVLPQSRTFPGPLRSFANFVSTSRKKSSCSLNQSQVIVPHLNTAQVWLENFSANKPKNLQILFALDWLSKTTRIKNFDWLSETTRITNFDWLSETTRIKNFDWLSETTRITSSQKLFGLQVPYLDNYPFMIRH
jgi:hypothetical protein